MTFDIQFLILALLILLLLAALGYVFFFKSIESSNKTAKRMNSLRSDPKDRAKINSSRVDEKQRRKMREDSLKTLEAAKDKDASNPNIRARITQAGLKLSIRKFYTISIIAAVVGCVLGKLFLGLPWHMALGAGIVFGGGLPRWVINFIRNRRFKKFTLEFPNAIDVIVRGIRAGLPLNDCIKIIADDAEEPVKSEFLKLIESTQVGLTMSEATVRLYESIPTPETNFFAIVISIQASAGGNLSEALTNLSRVLRERRKMADKIQSVSMEAKTSAGIIGGLPFAVAGMMWITSPGYIDPLFVTATGHKILLVSAGLMLFGIAIMKKMINFKF